MKAKIFIISRIFDTETPNQDKYYYNNRFDQLYDLEFGELSTIYLENIQESELLYQIN